MAGQIAQAARARGGDLARGDGDGDVALEIGRGRRRIFAEGEEGAASTQLHGADEYGRMGGLKGSGAEGGS